VRAAPARDPFPDPEPSGEALVAELERRFVTAVEEVDVDGQSYSILRPRNSDDLISEADFVRDDRLPYWADVWPSSRVLAARMRHAALLDGIRPGDRLLELGCGSGVVAVAATRAGYAVTATDYYEDALRFTRANVWRATGRDCETRLVDWRAMPPDLGRFDLVVASDVLYEPRYAELVAKAIAGTLARGGVAIVADPGRLAAPAFLEEAAELGLDLREPEEHVISANGTTQTIRLHTMRHR
jgi:predicted nicotinamide N-methyase